MLNIIEFSAVHLQVFVNREKGTEEGNDNAKQKDCCRYNNDVLETDDSVDGWLKVVQPVQTAENSGVGKDG